VTTSAPGSKVVGNIYVPAVHPSVHASTRPCMEDAEERFLTPKFRAANRLTLQADWRALFTKVAPRGAPGEPIGGPRLFEGTASDYEAEGGELYPDLDPRSAQATELWRWWEHGRQPWCIPHGGANVIQFLRVYTDGEGYQRYKEWSQSELAAWHQWRLSVGGYVCPPGELDKSTADAMANQSAKRANLSDGDYTPYWLGAPAGPVDRCDVTSASRRRKNLKKAAVIAGVVVGAVFLGPTIAGALKSAAGGIGAKIGSVTSKIIPKVVQGVNTVATIKAVKEGKVPPPPIALDGTRFVDYASAIGTNLVERELQEQGQELAASERALLEAQMQQQVRALQQSAAAQLPASLRTGYPLSTVSPAVRDAMTSAPPEWIKFAAVGGAALFLAVMLSR
jgi:hypothetical protein